jgi:hypothetical protein
VTLLLPPIRKSKIISFENAQTGQCVINGLPFCMLVRILRDSLKAIEDRGLGCRNPFQQRSWIKLDQSGQVGMLPFRIENFRGWSTRIHDSPLHNQLSFICTSDRHLTGAAERCVLRNKSITVVKPWMFDVERRNKASCRQALSEKKVPVQVLCADLAKPSQTTVRPVLSRPAQN